LLFKHHKAFLSEHGGKRPERWGSSQCAILEDVLTLHFDRWEVVKAEIATVLNALLPAILDQAFNGGLQASKQNRLRE